jgi:hypothetical protein
LAVRDWVKCLPRLVRSFSCIAVCPWRRKEGHVQDKDGNQVAGVGRLVAFSVIVLLLGVLFLVGE